MTRRKINFHSSRSVPGTYVYHHDSDTPVVIVPDTEAPAAPEREFTGRRKIDDLVARLMMEGELTIEEGLAIGASVRWVSRHNLWDRDGFRQKYGEIALDGAGMLMEEAK